MSTVMDKTDMENAIETLLQASSIGINSRVLSTVIAETLSKEHRTNQQSFIRMLTEALSQYADTCGTDARNEAAVEWAKQSTEDVGPFPYI